MDQPYVRISWAIAALCWAGIILLSLLPPGGPGDLTQLIEQPIMAVGWAGRLAAWFAALLVLAAGLGMAAAFAARPAHGHRPGPGRAAAFSVAGLALVVATALVGGSDTAVWPAIVAACVAGLLAGWAWQWNRAGRLLVVAAAVLLPIALGVLGLRMVNRAFVPRPTPIKVDAEQKRRLAEMLHEGHENAPAHQPIHVDWSARDLTLLANWGLEAAGMPNARTDVHIANPAIAVEAILPAGGRWVHFSSHLQLAVRDRRLVFDIHSLRLGDVAVPDPLTHRLTAWINRQAQVNPDLTAVSAAIESLAVSGDRLSVALVPERVPEDWLRDLTRPDDRADTRLAVDVYFDHLLDQLAAARGTSVSLDRLVNWAFALARDRSQAGADPADENAAAIVALATLAGHPRVGRMHGLRFDDARTRQQVQRQLNRVRLHGRNDLARHFWVSAAVAVIANQAISDLLGLLKEEIDSGEGGSGFSFVDLMADRAGTRFAAFATATAPNARHAQQRLTGPDPVGPQLMPDPRDLPEGLTQAQLRQQYGGIGGQRYQALLQQIERRLDAATLLQRDESPMADF